MWNGGPACHAGLAGPPVRLFFVDGPHPAPTARILMAPETPQKCTQTFVFIFSRTMHPLWLECFRLYLPASCLHLSMNLRGSYMLQSSSPFPP